MNLQDISKLRLINQQIAGSEFKTAKEVVGWMGAMQAQDFSMVKWAIGARLPGSSENTIDSAIDKGEIIRTHLLRPTWHFVSSDDIFWMLSLTAHHIKASMKSRDKQLELDESIYRKSNSIFVKALEGGNQLTREELMTRIRSANIDTSENRSSHLLMRAELDGLICSGKTENNKQTYALLAERAHNKKTYTRNEALAKLAQVYFRSHGPATLQDFIWWSGLPVADARNALESVRSEFTAVSINNQTYWFTTSVPDAISCNETVYFLPAFDEFIISYKDRTSALCYDNHRKAVSSNGIFRPTIVVNGKVEGIWRRSVNKTKVLFETGFFRAEIDINREIMEKAISAFGNFIGKEINHSEFQIVELK